MFGFLRPRKKHESLFGAYVPPEVVNEVIKTGMAGVNQFERKNFDFLFVAVDGTSEEEIGARIGTVLSVARESDWFISSICSTLVVLVDNSALDNRPTKAAGPVVVKQLVQQLGPNCKSVGGRRIAAWGDYGSPIRRVLGPLLPDFLQLVAALERQPFGSHVQADTR